MYRETLDDHHPHHRTHNVDHERRMHNIDHERRLHNIEQQHRMHNIEQQRRPHSADRDLQHRSQSVDRDQQHRSHSVANGGPIRQRTLSPQQQFEVGSGYQVTIQCSHQQLTITC